jgi:hypothetical protein
LAELAAAQHAFSFSFTSMAARATGINWIEQE